VVDPRWVKPIDEALVGAARQHRLVAVVEDNGRVGGFGDAVSRLLRDHDVDMPVKTYGLPQEFLSHGTREEVLEEVGLTSQHLARQITEAWPGAHPAISARRPPTRRHRSAVRRLTSTPPLN